MVNPVALGALYVGGVVALLLEAAALDEDLPGLRSYAIILCWPLTLPPLALIVLIERLSPWKK